MLYSATAVGDMLLDSAYSTTVSSFDVHNIIPTLGFSLAFFSCLSSASK